VSLFIEGYSPPPVILQPDIAESSTTVTPPQQQHHNKSDSSSAAEPVQYGTFDQDKSPLSNHKEQQPTRPVSSSGIDVDID